MARICRSQSSKDDQFRQGRGSIPRFGIILLPFVVRHTIFYSSVVKVISCIGSVIRHGSEWLIVWRECQCFAASICSPRRTDDERTLMMCLGCDRSALVTNRSRHQPTLSTITEGYSASEDSNQLVGVKRCCFWRDLELTQSTAGL